MSADFLEGQLVEIPIDHHNVSNSLRFLPKENSDSKSEFFTRADSLKIKPTNWLIEDYLENDTLGLIFADPGAYKSFVALSISAAIATGTTWFGQEVKQGAVFYIAGEGFNGLAKRLKAWEIHNGISLTGAPLYLSNRSAQFYDEESAEMVLDEIYKIAQRTGTIPVLIIIDTLARNFGGGDENSTKDMGIVVSHLDSIRASWGCSILLVHHTGHAEKGRARGAMALKGALDFEYQMSKDENGIATFKCTKTKDVSEPTPKHFELMRVHIPDPENSEQIEGAALVEINTPQKTHQRKLSDQKRRALEVLHECLIDQGTKRIIRNNMPTVMSVTLAEFRGALKRANICASDKPDTVAKAITRAIEGLNNSKITATYGDYIWLADKSDIS